MKMEINPSDYKILIVDDVASNVLLLKVLLTSEHFNIVTAADGQQALDQVKAESPDLILLDIMMPGMDGYEVAKRLKEDGATADIPIIFLTALNATSDVVKGFQIGGNDYISKPFNKEELIIRVMHQISLVAAKRVISAQTQELRKTITGRDKLYSVIAHDLRTPVGSVKMVLDMLMLNLSAEKIGEEMYEMLTMADQKTEVVFAVIDNLLKWTKSQLGKLNLVFKEMDLVDVAKSVVDVSTVVAGLKKITIHFESPEKLLVHADFDMIKTVVRNLVSNAVKYSYSESDIFVTIEAKEGKAIFSIQDYGCGLSGEDQGKLLHLGTHFSKPGTMNEEGSGLGLLLCKVFVEQNKGKLWFNSVAGKGSTFGFELPLG